jgi:hypothetical protein
MHGDRGGEVTKYHAFPLVDGTQHSTDGTPRAPLHSRLPYSRSGWPSNSIWASCAPHLGMATRSRQGRCFGREERRRDRYMAASRGRIRRRDSGAGLFQFTVEGMARAKHGQNDERPVRNSPGADVRDEFHRSVRRSRKEGRGKGGCGAVRPPSCT